MMTFTNHLLLLAARQSDVFKSMGSGFRDKKESFDASDLLWWVFAAVVFVTIFGIVARIITNRDKNRLYNSPRALFRELCKAHELDHYDRNLLNQIAKYQRLTAPARLFVEPERFHAASLSPALRESQSAVDALKTKLFA